MSLTVGRNTKINALLLLVVAALPVLPLALMGLWSARYGEFPARPVEARPAARRPRTQPGGAR